MWLLQCGPLHFVYWLENGSCTVLLTLDLSSMRFKNTTAQAVFTSPMFLSSFFYVHVRSSFVTTWFLLMFSFFLISPVFLCFYVSMLQQPQPEAFYFRIVRLSQDLKRKNVFTWTHRNWFDFGGEMSKTKVTVILIMWILVNAPIIYVNLCIRCLWHWSNITLLNMQGSRLWEKLFGSSSCRGEERTVLALKWCDFKTLHITAASFYTEQNSLTSYSLYCKFNDVCSSSYNLHRADCRHIHSLGQIDSVDTCRNDFCSTH